MFVVILSLNISINFKSEIIISIPLALKTDFESANLISSVSKVGTMIETLFFKQISNKTSI